MPPLPQQPTQEVPQAPVVGGAQLPASDPFERDYQKHKTEIEGPPQGPDPRVGADPLRGILDPIQVDPSIKADAWDAWHGVNTPEEFRARFDKLNLPNDIKANLWDLKFKPPVSDIQGALKVPGVQPVGPQAAPPMGPMGWYGPTVDALKRGFTAPGTMFGPQQPQPSMGDMADQAAQQVPGAIDQMSEHPLRMLMRMMMGGSSMPMSEQGAIPAQPTFDVQAAMQPKSAFGQGMAQATSGLTSPQSMAQLAMLPQSKGFGAFYGAQMGAETGGNIQDAIGLIQQGKVEEAKRLFGEATVSAIMTGGIGLHLMRGERGPADMQASPRETPAETPSTIQRPAPGVQVGPGQSPSFAQEGSAQPTTNAGQTGAKEIAGQIAGYKSPGIKGGSAPIEGPQPTVGTVTPKPTEEVPRPAQREIEDIRKRSGLPLTDDAVIRRIQERSVPGVMSPQQAAQKFGLRYRGEVSPGTGVHDFQAPDGGSIAFRPDELTPENIQAKLAQRKVEIKPENLSDVAKAKAPQAPTTPAAGGEPLRPAGQPQEPSYRTGQPVQPPTESVPDARKLIAPGAPTAEPVRRAPLRMNKLSDAELRPIAETELKPGVKQVGPHSRDAILAAKAEWARRQGTTKAPSGAERHPIHQVLERFLKTPGRQEELAQAVEKLPAEQRPQVAQEMRKESEGAAATLQEVERLKGAKDFDAMLQERLGAGAWTGQRFERGAGTGFGPGRPIPKFVSDLDTPTREWFNRLRGSSIKEVPRDPDTGEVIRSKNLADPEIQKKVNIWEDELRAITDQVRARGGQPTPEQNERAITLLTGLQATKESWGVFAGQGRPEVGAGGAVKAPGVRQTREFLNAVMGRKGTAEYAKPSAEEFQRRIDYLQRRQKAADAIARHLGGGEKAPEAVAKAPEKPVEAPKAAPKAEVPAKAPEAPKTAPKAPVEEPKVPPAPPPTEEEPDLLRARQIEELRTQERHLANLQAKGKGSTFQARQLEKSTAKIRAEMGPEAPKVEERVGATIAGEAMLKKAAKAEPRPAPEVEKIAPQEGGYKTGEAKYTAQKIESLEKQYVDAIRQSKDDEYVRGILSKIAAGREELGTDAPPISPEFKAAAREHRRSIDVQRREEGEARRTGRVAPKEDPSQRGALTLGGRPSGKPPLLQRMREASDNFKKSRVLEEGLNELEFMRQADRMRFNKGLDKVRKVSAPGVQTAMYRAAEGGGQYLAAHQRLYTQHIKPWVDWAEANYHWLSGHGQDVENYVRRVAIRKNTMWDRIARGGGQYTLGSVLKNTASSMKGRSFFELEHPGIARNVIAHVDANDNVTVWVNGQAAPTGLKRDVIEANGGQFKTAKTDDITRHSGQEYMQHLYVAAATNAMELASARRATEFLEAYKQSPDFQSISKKIKPGGPIPDGYSISKVPQLQGYALEKHTAEVLDRYYERLQKSDPTALDNANEFLTSTIYWNPLKHGRNVLDHWATYHGLSTFLRPGQYRPMVKAMLRAGRAVLNTNQDYMDAWDSGMPLRGHMQSNRQFNNIILKELNRELGTPQGVGLAKAWGYANPREMYHRILDTSRKALFGFDDILRLQATYHLQETTGRSFKESWKEVSKHLPDYTVPTRVGVRIPFTDIDRPSKTLAGGFQSKALMFGRYHYGRLRSYGEMAQQLVSKNVPAAERAKVFDRAAMIALTMALYSTAGTIAARKIAGSNKAEMSPSGATALPWQIFRVLHGQSTLGRAFTQTFTPSPVLDLAGRTIYGKFTKPQPIGKQLKEAAKDVIGEVGPVREGKQSSGMGDFFRRAFLNVYTPKAKSSGGVGRKLPGLGSLGKIR